MTQTPWSQRDKAYQPRATPWGFNVLDSSVLKERRISLDGEHVHDQPRFGVPSERERCTIFDPEVAQVEGLPPSRDWVLHFLIRRRFGWSLTLPFRGSLDRVETLGIGADVMFLRSLHAPA